MKLSFSLAKKFLKKVMDMVYFLKDVSGVFWHRWSRDTCIPPRPLQTRVDCPVPLRYGIKCLSSGPVLPQAAMFNLWNFLISTSIYQRYTKFTSIHMFLRMTKRMKYSKKLYVSPQLSKSKMAANYGQRMVLSIKSINMPFLILP